MGWRGWLAMALTIGAGLVSAGVHALSMAWIAALCLNAVISRQLPPLPPVETCILLFGIATSLLLAKEGAKRAGTSFGIKDMIQAPVYWSLLTLAFAHALARLIFEPHRWDKTPHRPEVIRNEGMEVYADAGRQAA